MGRVIETYKGRDNKVRSVKIKTKRSELVRPIAKVCLLEALNVQPSQDKQIDNMPFHMGEE